MSRLRKSGAYQVVASPAEADAVVKGSGQMWVRNHLTSNSRNPGMNRQNVYGGYLSVELVGREERTLWSYLVTPDRILWTDVAGDLAGKMVKAMIAARQQARPFSSDSSTQSLAATTLRGAGGTFPEPLYKRWFQAFQQLHPSVQFEYQAVGSEKGIQLLQEGAVDFAASDASSSDARDLKLGSGYWRIPVVLGAVVPIYNLPGLATDLRFSPEMLAGIYLGKITRWNDPEIRKWNRAANLPDAEIAVVHRQDGSGTTFTFSDYLSKVSSEWRAKLAPAYQLNWPVGSGAEGNQGVANLVQSTPNAIGYVELVYAIRQQLTYGLVRNAAGVFTRANLETVAEAARQSIPSPTVQPTSITNPSRKRAYPIATYTWIVFQQQMGDSAKRAALLAMLEWVLTDGQRESSALAYTPLPPEVAEQQLQFVRNLMKPSATGAAPAQR